MLLGFSVSKITFPGADVTTLVVVRFIVIRPFLFHDNAGDDDVMAEEEV